MLKQRISPESIDAVLPQTQCGLCGFNGCMPYANALAADTAAINLCPPGGVDGLIKLAHLLDKDAAPFVADMEKKAKPPMVAVIREAECIGCTKCIQACPVDAILGAAKSMHTIITDECTGCELCIAPCPVDCIVMVPASDQTEKAAQFRQRYLARQQRLEAVESPSTEQTPTRPITDNKQSYIEAALLRAKNKKLLHL